MYFCCLLLVLLLSNRSTRSFLIKNLLFTAAILNIFPLQTIQRTCSSQWLEWKSPLISARKMSHAKCRSARKIPPSGKRPLEFWLLTQCQSVTLFLLQYLNSSITKKSIFTPREYLLPCKVQNKSRIELSNFAVTFTPTHSHMIESYQKICTLLGKGIKILRACTPVSGYPKEVHRDGFECLSHSLLLFVGYGLNLS